MNLNFGYRPDSSSKSRRLLTFVVLLLGIAWLKFGHHELWKDEWQAWLMARDMSWQELLGSLYYEGHPALWYLYLKLWSLLQVLPDTVLLQSAHLLLVGAAVAVVLFRFGMPMGLKIAFLLGYYPLFEYGVVNRGYAWVLLLSFLLVEQLKKPEAKPWVLAGLFFLLCQTEVYGVLIGGGLFFYFWLEKGLKPAFRAHSFWGALSGMALGLVVFVLSVYPRASQDELESAYLSNPLSAESLGLAFQGTLANTYWLGSIPDTNVFGMSVLGLLLSALVLAALLLLFWPQRRSFWAFLVFQLVFFLFASIVYTGGVRHWGMAMVFFICLWELHGREVQVLKSYRWLILGSILLFQLYYSGLAVYKELRYPFTNAKAAGLFIRDKVPADVPVLAINKFEAAPVLGYAGRTFYELPAGTTFSYFKWVEKVYIPPIQEIHQLTAYLNKSGMIVLSPAPLDIQNRYRGMQLWESFDAPSIKNEKYFLYSLPLPKR